MQILKMEWYNADGKHYTIPLNENERNSLIEQGVLEIFTKDFG